MVTGGMIVSIPVLEDTKVLALTEVYALRQMELVHVTQDTMDLLVSTANVQTVDLTESVILLQGNVFALMDTMVSFANLNVLVEHPIHVVRMVHV